MLKFPKEYYEGEELSGYYVKPYMKRRWAALLEVLAEFDRTCKKHGVEYFVDSGTLIGAVRHRGFIPWDDDLDVVMRRIEFEKFLKIAATEYNYYEQDPSKDRPGRLLYHTPRLAKEQYLDQTVITSGRHISFDDDYLWRFHGCPFVVGIDIYPLDYIPNEGKEVEIVLNILERMYYLLGRESNWNGGYPSNDDVFRQIMQICEMVGYVLDEDKNLRIQMIRLEDRLCSMYGEDESEYMQNLFWYPANRNTTTLYKKEWFDNMVYLDFEVMKVPCPKEYDKALRAVYGDYMAPKIYPGHGNYEMELLKEKNVFHGEDPEEALYRLMKLYN